MFTFLLTLFPILIRLFYFYMCIFLLCFFKILSLLLLRVGFEFSLTPFWGYLSFVSCAFVCFIKSFEPSMTRSGKLFIYLLTKLFET